MTATRTSKDSATNYDAQTTLTVDGGGDQVELTLTHAITQENILLTDETFTYNFPVSTSGFESFVESTRPDLLDAAAEAAGESLPSAPQDAVVEYIQREAPPGGRAAVRPILAEAEGALSLTVQTNSGDVPGTFEQSASITFDHPLTVPVTEGVSESARNAIRGQVADAVEPALSFTTQPRNEDGDLIPEFTASSVETEVSVPAQELVTFEEVSPDPVTPSLATPRISDIPGIIEPGESFSPTLSLATANNIPGEYTVIGPVGDGRQVSVPASGRVAEAFTLPPESFAPGDVLSFTVNNADTGEKVAEATFQPPSVEAAVSALATEFPNTVEPRLPTEGLTLPLTITNEGDAPTEAAVLVNGTPVTDIEAPAGETVSPDVQVGGSLLPEDGGDITVTVRNTETREEETATIPAPVETPEPELPPLERGDLSLGVTPPGSPPAPGAEAVFEYAVENTRGTETGPFTLTVGDSTETLSLAPGEMVTNEVELSRQEPGRLQLPVEARKDGVLITRDSATVPVELPEKPDLPEEPETPVEEPVKSLPEIEVLDLSGPPSITANDPFSVQLTVQNVGDAAGDVRVRGPSGRETLTLSPGSSATYQGENLVVDDPGGFSLDFRVTNVETGDTKTEVLTGDANPLPTPEIPSDEVLDFTTYWPVGNESFRSQVRVEVTSAQVDDGESEIEYTLVNRPDRGGGFFSTMVIVAEVGGETVTQERSTGPAGGGGTARDQHTVTVPAVAPTGTVSFYPEYEDSPGDIRDVVRGGEAEATFPIAPPAPPEFALDSFSPPSSVAIGEEYTPEMVLENVGEQPGEVEVSGPGIAETVRIPPGETKSVEPTVANTSAQPNQLSYTLRNVEEGTTKTVTRTVGTEVPSFALTDVAAPDSVSSGEPFTVDAEVANVGSVQGDVQVRAAESVERVTLGPGESTTVSLSGLEARRPPSQRLTVTAINAATGAEQSTGVFVAVLQSAFAFTRTLPDEDATFGEEARPGVEVTNVSETPGEYEVTGPSGAQTGTLSPGESEAVRFTTPANSPQPQQIGVRGVNLSTGDQFGSTTVGITPQVPQFSVADVELPATPGFGEDVTVDAEVVNDGEAPGEYELRGAGTVKSGSLDPGEAETVSFGVSIDSLTVETLSLTGQNVTLGRPFGGEEVRITPSSPTFDIASTSGPTDPSLTAPGTVTATVENTGTESGEYIIRADGRTQTGALSPGVRETVTFQAPATSTDTQTVTVTGSNPTLQRQFGEETVTYTPSAPSFNLRVQDAPESLPVGESGEVVALVENTGGASGEYELEAAGETKTGALSPGESTTARFPVSITSQSPATLTLRGENRTLDRSLGTQSVRVEPALPAFTIVSLDAPSDPAIGEAITYTVGVENTGGAPGEYEITTEGQSATGRLAPGEAAQETFTTTVQTEDGKVVSATGRNTTLGSQLGTESVRLDPVTPSFSFTSSTSPEGVQVGEEAGVTATLENTGEAPGEYEVQGPGETKTGVLSPDAARTVRFGVTLEDPAGQSVRLTGRNTTLGTTFGTESIRIDPVTPSFSFASVSGPETVPVGEQATVTAVVENTGDGAGEYEVQGPGETKTGSLSPEAERTLRFQVAPGTAGSQTVTLSGRDTTLGSAFGPETVSFEAIAPSFSVVSVTPPETPEPVGSEDSVAVTVQNDGTAPGTATVSVDGRSRTVTLQPGSTAEASVPFVVSDSSVTTRSVTVEGETGTTTPITRRFTVTPPTPSFSITSFSLPETISQGSSGRASVTVSEDAGFPGVARVQFPATGARERVEVPADSSRTVSFDVPAPRGRTARVTSVVSWAATGMEMDRATGTVSTPRGRDDREEPSEPSEPSPEPPEARPSISIRSVDAPRSAEAGETFTVRVSVRNGGDRDADTIVSVGGSQQRLSIPAGSTRSATVTRTQPPSGGVPLSVTARSLFYPSERDETTVEVESETLPDPSPPTPGEDDETFIETLLGFFFPGVE